MFDGSTVLFLILALLLFFRFVMRNASNGVRAARTANSIWRLFR